MDRLAALGVTGIEVAPTRIAAWDVLSVEVLTAYKRAATAAGLAIPSVQAIFFGRPDDQLLGETAAFRRMTEHMRRIGDIAGVLGAQIAVFGAPRNRNRGTLREDEAQKLAVERLRVLGDIAQAAGLALGLEPVPIQYGADFLLRAADIRRLVASCAHPGVRPHLDAACVTLSGDAIADEIIATHSDLAHYHIAEADLGPFEAPICPHEQAAGALREIGYNGWCVIEMREQNNGFAAVEAAVQFAHRVYG
jgi:sugar phosphate isomerase/epimerase